MNNVSLFSIQIEKLELNVKFFKSSNNKKAGEILKLLSYIDFADIFILLNNSEIKNDKKPSFKLKELLLENFNFKVAEENNVKHANTNMEEWKKDILFTHLSDFIVHDKKQKLLKVHNEIRDVIVSIIRSFEIYHNQFVST